MIQSTLTIPSNSQSVSSFRSYSRGASVLAVLVGSLVLAGYVLDIPPLKSVFPRFVTMKVNAAISFILAGLALYVTEKEPKSIWMVRLAQACAVIVSLIGLLTLGEYLFGWDLGIDQLLIEEPVGTLGSSFPGRMAAFAAVSFLLISLALLLLHVETSGGSRPAEFLALTTAAISVFSFTGYLFGVDFFYGVAPYTALAIHTSVTFIVLSVGVLSARPDRGWMAMITTAGPASWRVVFYRRLSLSRYCSAG